MGYRGNATSRPGPARSQGLRSWWWRLVPSRSPAQWLTWSDGVVFIKDLHVGSTRAAQLKVEVLNPFNRVNVRALRGAGTFGNSNFGQTNIQAGFMRITQIMFRFSF